MNEYLAEQNKKLGNKASANDYIEAIKKIENTTPQTDSKASGSPSQSSEDPVTKTSATTAEKTPKAVTQAGDSPVNEKTPQPITETWKSPVTGEEIPFGTSGNSKIDAAAKGLKNAKVQGGLNAVGGVLVAKDTKETIEKINEAAKTGDLKTVNEEGSAGVGRLGAGWIGGVAGAKAGAALGGSILDGPGAVVFGFAGGVVGGVLGSWLGDKGGREIGPVVIDGVRNGAEKIMEEYYTTDAENTKTNPGGWEKPGKNNDWDRINKVQGGTSKSAGGQKSNGLVVIQPLSVVKSPEGGIDISVPGTDLDSIDWGTKDDGSSVAQKPQKPPVVKPKPKPPVVKPKPPAESDEEDEVPVNVEEPVVTPEPKVVEIPSDVDIGVGITRAPGKCSICGAITGTFYDPVAPDGSSPQNVCATCAVKWVKDHPKQESGTQSDGLLKGLVTGFVCLRADEISPSDEKSTNPFDLGDSVPCPGVEVFLTYSVKGQRTKITAITDEKGGFSASVPVGPVEVTARGETKTVTSTPQNPTVNVFFGWGGDVIEIK